VYRAANPRNDIGSDGIKEYDAVVIGGGLVGVSISRLLAQRNVKVCVVEKAHDLGEGASKSNSAIIHTGTGSRLWTPYSVSIM
jgi:L-2-hydroxyglutarate oxidase LhgO